jgi:hypothetical protein
MKITIESYETIFTTQTKNDDLSIQDYVDIINNMLLSIGFHQDTILEGFEEFIQSKKEDI